MEAEAGASEGGGLGTSWLLVGLGFGVVLRMYV